MLCLRVIRSLPRVTGAQIPKSLPLSRRALSIISPTRPSLLLRHARLALATSSPQSETTLSSSLNLIPRISTHPSLANIQVRNGPRDTYDPSHRVRKRRHGFLSRVRTRKGKNTLKRRKLKQRSTLSH